MRTFSILAATAIAVLIGASTTANAGNPPVNAHAFSFTSIDEKTSIDLKQYRGKVVLVVNTASFCGFTPQYTGLQNIWQDYRNKGVVVLGVPSNDFGAQEPKSEAEIKDFCQGAFNVTFPLTAKVRVRGAQAHAFYRWIDRSTGGKASPRWNFHKILIAADGRLAEWFASSVRPSSLKQAIEREIEKAKPES
ncbi:MAG: glutathione peroxidase [Aestuariivirgaceae bacterium]